MSKILSILLATTSFLWSQTKLHEGVIEGAKFKILSAEKPSGKVLLLAHGYRNEDQILSADFCVDGTLSKNLLRDGWTIASTSFRRNGWIIDDALADLRALQTKITELQGKPNETYLIGNSMGGQIATLAAEGALDIHGAITTGVALQDYPKQELNPKITYLPKVPLIHLINQESNRRMAVTYHKKAGDKLCAYWKIERPGHCNVSDSEKLSAINALQDWKAGKNVDRIKDATMPIPEQPSTSKVALIGTATEISESWGNITTSFVKADLTTLGVSHKDTLIVNVGQKSQSLTLASHYDQVPQKEGAAYLNSEGYLRIQFNGDNLAKKLKIKTGDSLNLTTAH